ncbi:MAG: SdrD B-like domain-containing protein, partial [Thermodesulfobacteriota bacterium]|nr:SdrD B-like domain-containing protein [Thermodesulfobacteriota bacterium]
NPPNFVSTDDGYSLDPGETLTLTFDVTVDDPLATGIEEITNTAFSNCNEIILPISDDATNIVTNPSSGTADVGDLVWLDTDGDGTKDVGEPGLFNVEVTLKDQYGTPVATTTTDSTGHYIFTDVEPGDDYYVEVTDGLPAGLTQTAPSGHSDDRTDPFDLSAGDSYMTADLGYAPASGTAAFGDLVWSDADGDGVHDPGEPGLEGITVEIYLDDGDGYFDPGASGDTLVTTTTTAPGGSYLFTGITASGTEDYHVYVDTTQTALSGYTGTTSNPLLTSDVSAGDVWLYNDFGFQNASSTYTIEDRVWFDTNEDEQDDSESGISGVTVDLLDDSLNVIATTTTDGTGYFTFSGVAGGGADYTVRITDSDGLLDDYYGTTAEAIAGEMAINNLTGDLDYTTEPTEPNFGYNLSKAIGDLIWNDLDGDQTQDAGEAGISGVTVDLYLDDGDGNFEPGGDDGLPVATRTTDANGNYLFSGLSDGTYFVDVDNSQAALSGYDSLTTPDQDVASGHQREVSISGGNNNLDADFGYRATTSYTASGTIWEDDDHDGVIDGGESLFEDVTVELFLDDGDGTFEPYGDDTLVGTTSTDGSGGYSFTGLPSDDYWVLVTDDIGVLSGYETTYEKTEGTTGPFNDREAVALTSNQTDIHFGYDKPLVTLVVLSSFRAYKDGGKTVVEWQTAAEIGTVGFYLKRLDEKKGKFKRVNKKLLPGLLHSLQGGTYRYIDDKAAPGGTYTYKLVEVEASGKKRRYGPFTVTVGGQGLDLLEGELAELDVELLMSQYSRKAHKMSDAKKARIKARKKARKEAKALRKKRRAKEKAKIAVIDDGLYYVGAEEIASVLGLTTEKVEKKIKKARLRVSTQGKKVAYLAAEGDSGIYFYGQAIESIYTKENMYWLKQGKGKKMRELEGEGPEPVSGEETFLDTVHVEEDLWALPAFFDDPEADYWLWDYIYAGYPGLDVKTFTVRTDGASLDGTATLVANLQGGSDTECGPQEHHAVVSINGVEVGEAYWAGTTAYALSVEFDQSLLYDGENTVEVKGLLDTCAAYSIIYVDAFDMSYERLYRAVDNKLMVRGEGNATVTIEGFTDDGIVVFDLTNARKPKLVKGTTIDEAYGAYRVSFSPSRGDKPYLAMTMGASTTVGSLTADVGSTLKRKKNAVDYLVITPGDLKDGAQALADYRQGKGLRTMVVELQDVYDQFNHGIATPHAIKDFLSYAYHNWRRAPTYVVLVGEGTFDYKDLQGYGDNMVPPLMISTPYGLFASDNRLVDVEGDEGVPEMAIGRLPVVTQEELNAYIGKVQGYESSGGDWTQRVLMVADDP